MNSVEMVSSENITKVEKKSAETQKKLLAFNEGDQKTYAKKVKQLKKTGKTARVETGVMYVGHLPSQFQEPQLRRYFEQFGKILRMRLSRSKKSGKSKGYAFLEFEDSKDARIASKTMDKYLFHERLLQCKMMDKTKLNENIWKGANKTFKVGLAYRAARSAHNKSQSDKNKAKTLAMRKKKDVALMAALKDAGVEGFQAPVAKVASVVTQTKDDKELINEEQIESSKKNTKKRTFAEAEPEADAESGRRRSTRVRIPKSYEDYEQTFEDEIEE